MTLYMAVTNDHLKLPVCIEDQMKKVGHHLGMGKSHMSRLFGGQRGGKYDCKSAAYKFVTVEIEDDEDGREEDTE